MLSYKDFVYILVIVNQESYLCCGPCAMWLIVFMEAEVAACETANTYCCKGSYYGHVLLATLILITHSCLESP